MPATNQVLRRYYVYGYNACMWLNPLKQSLLTCQAVMMTVRTDVD